MRFFFCITACGGVAPGVLRTVIGGAVAQLNFNEPKEHQTVMAVPSTFSTPCHQCGACCTEISITSPIPGMPDGKPAGIKCIHLQKNLCGLFDSPTRPRICSSFEADMDMCGLSHGDAVTRIRWYERETKPGDIYERIQTDRSGGA